MKSAQLAARSVMIVAGEASGDLHGASLVRAMLEERADLIFYGMGGKELRRAGVDILRDSDAVAVMGLAEILGALKDILSALRLLKHTMRHRRPDLLILIDFADFNLRLAKEAKGLGIPVFYYITPKVWAWRKRRTKSIARYVDAAGVILPFEEEYLRKRGVNAVYVGNPVLDAVDVHLTRSMFCEQYGIDSTKALVGIIPGSRRKEVHHLLPVFLEAARRMDQKYAREVAFILPLASTLSVKDLEDSGLREYRDKIEIHVIDDDRYEAMANCDAVVAASGTVTLELAVLDVPMLVAYKFSPWTYYIGKLLINIPFFSLVNIIAGRKVVTEILQHQVQPGTVEIELARILFDEHGKGEMKKDLQEVRRALGEKGASCKAAKLALKTMESR